MYIPIPENINKKMITVNYNIDSLLVQVKGQEPIINGKFYEKINVDESVWTIEDGELDGKKSRYIHIVRLPRNIGDWKVEEPEQLVEHSDQRWPRNQHAEDQPGALEVGGPIGRDQVDGGENDVRHASEANGAAEQRWTSEAGKAKGVHEGTPRDGLLEVQI